MHIFLISTIIWNDECKYKELFSTKCARKARVNAVVFLLSVHGWCVFVPGAMGLLRKRWCRKDETPPDSMLKLSMLPRYIHKYLSHHKYWKDVTVSSHWIHVEYRMIFQLKNSLDVVSPRRKMHPGKVEQVHGLFPCALGSNNAEAINFDSF